MPRKPLPLLLLACCLVLGLGLENTAAAPLKEYVERFAALGDRSVGSPGNAQAADIVEQVFEQTAAQARQSGTQDPIIGRHQFQVPVIRNQQSLLHLVKEGRSEELRPLTLNALSTGAIAEPGIEGPLIYVGEGRLQDFNGSDVKDAVVLMDMDSGKNWQNAALLGAQALIYIDKDLPEAATRGMFEQKLELTPIDFPRFWMRESRAAKLFRNLKEIVRGEAAPRVRLSSKIAWHNAVTENIYLLIPGTEPELSKELLVLEAFYDSTSFVAGVSPGADEASSIASLLATAEELGRNPPKRSALLLASSGHAQDVAGMREVAWALSAEPEQLQELAAKQKERLDRARQTFALLQMQDPLGVAHTLGKAEAEMLHQALDAVLKTRLESVNTTLIRLRLQPEPDEERIRQLADRRNVLRRIVWVESARLDVPIDPGEKMILDEMLPEALEQQQSIIDDAGNQLASLESAIELRALADQYTIAAMFSLHLSSHGDGLGAFDKGWLYDLDASVNRTRFFGPLDDMLRETAQTLPEDVGSLLKDTLRPSKLRNWQSYLPDRPLLDGEPGALAGLPSLSLVTVQDARVAWGTPGDLPRFVDFPRLEEQRRLLAALARALADQPLPNVGERFKSGFASLFCRANLLRQGELFPDKPAFESVFLTYTGASRLYSMVDTAGAFRVVGIPDRRHTVHKAILEGYRIDPDTGLATWAVDKPGTGKDNYRVKMRRAVMEADLVMFPCMQSTLFNAFEPRTFNYMIYTTLLDGRTEAEPLRYWYSRLDTRSSTLFSVFLEPGTPFKLTLSDSYLVRKVLLLNGSKKNPQGSGFVASKWPVIPFTEFQSASDMWHLLTPRIMALEERGIVNQRLWSLAHAGEEALREAEQHRQELRWDKFMEKGRESLAIAGQVYTEVEKTQKDVLSGVLFYIALFVPFAYCLERLVFAFANIHKRIIAFSSFLVAIIGIIYVVHPAFELTYSPMIVILAFFILGLSLLVSLIIFFRFEREMKELQQRSRHFKLTDLSKTAAFGAAFVLGVTNLRRRPIRTALTCVTLVILTFTIMNFTAVKSVNQSGWSSFSDHASYKGLFMKAFGWLDLPPEALQVVRSMLGDQGVVAPRVWFEIKDKTRSPIVPLKFKDKEKFARGVVGLSHLEPRVTRLDEALVAGDWFSPEARREIILPQTMARELGVRPGEHVDIWGMDILVAGIIADNALEAHPDLDGEAMTPIIYPSEADTRLSDAEAEAIEQGEDVASYKSRYQHIPADQTVIIPAETLLALGGSGGWLAGGGRLKGMALKLSDEEERTLSQEELGARFGLLLFRGSDKGTSVYYSANTFQYSGMANIIIPLVISALIVLNTMVGSVFERKNEIAVYTSVGLAPSHVSFLFVAESLAFAVLSVVAGYLMAQAAAVILAGTPLWAGMTANYSSLAGVGAMVLVIGVVLLSAIYPSRVAASIAIPDVNRSWTMPAAKGDVIDATLPFLIKISEQACAGGFLAEYYDAHRDVSHGLFSTNQMACGYLSPNETQAEETPPVHWVEDILAADSCLSMNMRVWLAPFDFGVRQRVELIFCPSELYQGFRQIKLRIHREAGEHTVWHNLNRTFINDLRKQLLAWRSLDAEAKDRYEMEFIQAYATPKPTVAGHKDGDS